MKMQQDFTLLDASSLMEHVGLSDRSEHEGYLDELEQFDFSQEQQARAAIRKWLVPAFETGRGSTSTGRRRVREAFRVALSLWGFVPHGPGLPGVDEDRPPYRPEQHTYALTRNFYAWVWDELFHEPFDPMPATDSLSERDDDSFVNAPNNPEQWGTPRYRSITHWDQVLRTDAWRENWPRER